MPLAQLQAAQIPLPETRMAAFTKFLSKNFLSIYSLLFFSLTMLPSVVSAKVGSSDYAGQQLYFTRVEYLVFLVLVIFAQYYKHTAMYWIAKPLPMLFLIHRSFYIATTPSSTAIFAGLLFGVLGDMVLIFSRYFRAALSLGAMAFFFGHVSYVAAFVACPLSAGKEVWVAWVGAFLIFMHEYYYYMLKHAPFVEFLFGLVYWTAISVMFVASINADHHLWMMLKHGMFPYAFLGSFLFLLSDLCIHWVIYVDSDNHFLDKMILPLYYTGQLLICQAAIGMASLGL